MGEWLHPLHYCRTAGRRAENQKGGDWESETDRPAMDELQRKCTGKIASPLKDVQRTNCGLNAVGLSKSNQIINGNVQTIH